MFLPKHQWPLCAFLPGLWALPSRITVLLSQPPGLLDKPCVLSAPHTGAHLFGCPQVMGVIQIHPVEWLWCSLAGKGFYSQEPGSAQERKKKSFPSHTICLRAGVQVRTYLTLDRGMNTLLSMCIPLLNRYLVNASCVPGSGFLTHSWPHIAETQMGGRVRVKPRGEQPSVTGEMC